MVVSGDSFLVGFFREGIRLPCNAMYPIVVKGFRAGRFQFVRSRSVVHGTAGNGFVRFFLAGRVCNREG